jgi:hypothetical protein
VTHVLGLMGVKRSGKDAFADSVLQYASELGLSASRIAFADPLREIAYQLNPIVGTKTKRIQGDFFSVSVRYVELIDEVGYDKAKENPEVRRLLQYLGTEAIRGVLGDSTWVDHLMESVDNTSADIVVVTDLRFPNEYDALTGMDRSTIVRVDRPGLEVTGDSHESENAWLDLIPDVIVTNDSTLVDLENAAKVLVDELVQPAVT